jgi:hypothetical protein
MQAYLTDEELSAYLSEYDERGYDDLPQFLQDELQYRNLLIPTRNPTELEIWETVKDAREHRIMNKELILQDYKDKYMKGKSLTLIT